MPHSSAPPGEPPARRPPVPPAPPASPAFLAWPGRAALGVLALALAVAIAPRGMGEGDAAEFTLALALGGVPHPSGYPLYTLFGHAFARALHAGGVSWPFAAVLWSATGAAVATFLVATLVDRLLPATGPGAPGRGGRLALVTAATLALAANPIFLRAATQAEVHTWHVAWVAGSALAVLALGRRLARGGVAGPALALAAGALLGAGLAHHLTAVFFLGPLLGALAVAAARAGGVRAPVVVAFAAGLALPLAAYGLVAWRAFHPAAYQWPALEPTWAGVVAHATGTIYRAYVGGFAPGAAERALLVAGALPLVAPGLPAALAVAVRSWRGADGPLLAALALAATLQLAFLLRYGVIDPSAYVLPVIVVSIVAGARAYAGWAARRTSPALGRGFALVALTVAALAWTRAEAAHARQVDAVGDAVHAAFRALPFERGVVVWSSDSYVRLRAHQLLEGDQPGLVVIHPLMLTWAPERRAQARALGFDPLAGMAVRSDADLAGVPANVARQTALPVVDFAAWWPQR